MSSGMISRDHKLGKDIKIGDILVPHQGQRFLVLGFAPADAPWRIAVNCWGEPTVLDSESIYKVLV